jgi:hypothetical protein
MFKENAMTYAAFGMPVFPLRPKEKSPISSMTNWPERCTTDPAQIEAWDAENPDYNLGVVAKLKPGGFCGLEFDVTKGLSAAAAEMKQGIPATLISKSGKGFGHLWFKHTERSLAMGNRQAHLAEKDENGKLKEWFSFRADNRYLVGAGSLHPNGNRYKFVRDHVVEPIPIPDWLCDWIEMHSTKTTVARTGATGPKMHEDFDIGEFIDHVTDACNVSFDEDYVNDGVTYYPLDGCPNNDGAEHSNQTGRKTCITMGEHGLGFHCFADQCHDFHIGDLLRKMRDNGKPYEGPIWEETDDGFDDIEDVTGCDEAMFNPLQPDAKPVTAAELFGDEPTLSKTADGLIDSAALGKTPAEAPKKKGPAYPELVFPEDCMYGKMGAWARACSTYEGKDCGLDLGLTYPAVMTLYSSLPAYDLMAEARINLYACLLAQVAAGKDTAIGRAIATLGLKEWGSMGGEIMSYSPTGEKMLTRHIGEKTVKDKPNEPGPKHICIVTYEIEDTMKKGQGDQSGLFQTLQWFYDHNQKTLTDSNTGKTIKADCRLSWLTALPIGEGKIDPDAFGKVFGQRSTHGMMSRMIWGFSEKKFDRRLSRKWKPPDGLAPCAEAAAADHVKDFAPGVERLYQDWENEDMSGRDTYVLLKVCVLTAAANGDKLITKECFDAAVKFVRWQAAILRSFKAGEAEDNPQARFNEAVMRAMERQTRKAIKMGKAPEDCWLHWRSMNSRLKWRKYGIDVAKGIERLASAGDLEYAVMVEDVERNGESVKAETVEKFKVRLGYPLEQKSYD